MKDISKMHSDFTVKDVYTGHVIVNTIYPSLVFIRVKFNMVCNLIKGAKGRKKHYMFTDI